jgi:hypothetical protein
MATPLAPGYGYTGQAKRRLSYGQVKQLAQAFGLPGDAIAQIAKGESGLYADVQQRDPGDSMVGYGLLQMTPNAWGKGSAAQQYLNKLGGVRAMSDPVKNMQMARFLYKAAGNKLTPWYGTRYLTNRSGEGKLGGVDRSMIPRAFGGAAQATGEEQAAAPSADTTSPAPALAALQALTLPQRPKPQITAPTAPVFSVAPGLAARTPPPTPQIPQIAAQQQPERLNVGKALEAIMALQPTANTSGAGGAESPSRDSGPSASGGPKGGTGKFTITGPSPERLQPHLTSFAKKVANTYGGTLVGSDGTGHSYLTTTGNVSQHSTGNATDIFTIGGKRKGDKGWNSTLIAAGRAALIAAGMPRAEAMKKGIGLYNVGSHQIIFGTNSKALGGDHTDHLHISAR